MKHLTAATASRVLVVLSVTTVGSGCATRRRKMPTTVLCLKRDQEALTGVKAGDLTTTKAQRIMTCSRQQCIVDKRLLSVIT